MILEPNYYAANGSARVAVRGTPEIDGKLDAAYNRAPAILLNKELYTNNVVSDRATGAAKAIYDDDYLYLFAEIEDLTLNSRDKLPKNNNSDLGRRTASILTLRTAPRQPLHPEKAVT